MVFQRALPWPLLAITMGACSLLFSAADPVATESDAAALDATVSDAANPGEVDATLVQSDAAPASACTSIGALGECNIECITPDCNGDIVCPAGSNCHVTCEGPAACENILVDCGQAELCTIKCIGADACDSGVRCGGTSCSIVCEGDAACEDGPVECEADLCDIHCNGGQACASGVCCNAGACTQCEPLNGATCECIQ